jgi:hypothetical protein
MKGISTSPDFEVSVISPPKGTYYELKRHPLQRGRGHGVVGGNS